MVKTEYESMMALSDEELNESVRAKSETVILGLNNYRDEIARRSNDRLSKRVELLTRVGIWIAGASLLSSIVQIAIAIFRP